MNIKQVILKALRPHRLCRAISDSMIGCSGFSYGIYLFVPVHAELKSYFSYMVWFCLLVSMMFFILQLVFRDRYRKRKNAKFIETIENGVLKMRQDGHKVEVTYH